MAEEKKPVLVEKRGKVAVVTLNRPEAANSHNGAMAQALEETWQDLKRDENVAVVVVTAAGNRHFCSGVDMRDAARQSQPGFTGRGATPWADIPEDFWKPVICAVNGVLAGGGWHFIWQSDFAIASENATFFEPEVSVGLMPLREVIGLANRAPLGVVLRLAFMGNTERLDARRAYEVGIVTEVVPQEKLLPRALEIAESIARQAPLAVRAAKEVLRRAYDLRFTQKQVVDYGEQLRLMVRKSEDAREGPRAFAEGRKPEWKGK